MIYKTLKKELEAFDLKKEGEFMQKSIYCLFFENNDYGGTSHNLSAWFDKEPTINELYNTPVYNHPSDPGDCGWLDEEESQAEAVLKGEKVEVGHIGTVYLEKVKMGESLRLCD